MPAGRRTGNVPSPGRHAGLDRGAISCAMSSGNLPRTPLGRNVFVAGLVSFFMDVSSEMIYPLVPLFLTGVLGASKSLIGVIEGIAESTAGLLKVGSGWYSDRIGRRKGLMAIGYGISTLSRPLIATAAAWPQVLASRFVDRAGKGIRTAPRDAIIAESTPSSHLGRAFGFHRALDTLGAVAGPALVLLLLRVFPNDYRKIFWISIVPGAIAVLLILLFIREKRAARPELPKPPASTPRTRLDRRTKGFILIATIFALGNSSDAFLILKAERVGIPTALIPAVYLTFNLVYSLSSLPAGMVADRFGRKRVILLGFLLFAALYLGFALAVSPAAVWLLFAAYGIFMGLTEGVQKAFLATIIPRDAKATAFGAYATGVGLAALPASLVGGWLWDHVSPSATFFFGAVTALLAAVLFFGLSVALRRAAP